VTAVPAFNQSSSNRRRCLFYRGHKRYRRWRRCCGARNLDPLITAGAINYHSRPRFLDSYMLPTVRTFEPEFTRHKRCFSAVSRILLLDWHGIIQASLQKVQNQNITGRILNFVLTYRLSGRLTRLLPMKTGGGRNRTRR